MFVKLIDFLLRIKYLFDKNIKIMLNNNVDGMLYYNIYLFLVNLIIF